MTEEDKKVSEKLLYQGAVLAGNGTIWRMGSTQIEYDSTAWIPWTVYLKRLDGSLIEIARRTTLLKAVSALEESVNSWMGSVNTYRLTED